MVDAHQSSDVLLVIALKVGVIGIAGGSAKADYLLNEIGCDAAVDYKADDLAGQLSAAAPDGIDVFFDNVGGEILDIVLLQINERARVVICGGISRYEQAVLPAGPANYFNLVFQRSTMSGFLVTDYASEFPAARARLATWLQQGDLVYKEDVQSGFEQIPATLKRVFDGANFGKQLLKL